MSDTEREHSDSMTKAESSKDTLEAGQHGGFEAEEQQKPVKVGLLKKIQTKLSLDVPTSLLMLK